MSKSTSNWLLRFVVIASCLAFSSESSAQIKPERIAVVHEAELTEDQSRIVASVMLAQWEDEVKRIVVQLKTPRIKRTEKAELQKRLDELLKGAMAGPPFDNKGYFTYDPAVHVPSVQFNIRRILSIPGQQWGDSRERLNVVSVVDDKNALLELIYIDRSPKNGETIWIEGLDFSSITDDQGNVPVYATFIELKPREYTTVLGGSRRVLAYQPLSANWLQEAWDRSLEDLSPTLSERHQTIVEEQSRRKR